MNIPDLTDGDDVVFVVTNSSLMHILEDSNNRMGNSVAATEYECLMADGPDVVAVVCHNQDKVADESIGGEIRKCCPWGQLLSSDLECSDIPGGSLSSPGQLPPRSLLSPATLRPAPALSHLRVRVTQGSWVTGGSWVTQGSWCQETGELVADLVRGVSITSGAVTRDMRMVDYQCMDRLRDQLVAVRCLEPRQCDLCVSKCCPPHQVFSHDRGCLDVSDEEHLWRHPERGYPTYHHNFIENFVRQKYFRRPGCEEVLILEHEDDVYHLLDDGTLHHKDYGVTENYCIDNFIDKDGQIQEIVLKCFSGGQYLI